MLNTYSGALTTKYHRTKPTAYADLFEKLFAVFYSTIIYTHALFDYIKPIIVVLFIRVGVMAWSSVLQQNK